MYVCIYIYILCLLFIFVVFGRDYYISVLSCVEDHIIGRVIYRDREDFHLNDG